uniref:Uncharacterized protein n=1 Tax=Arundo donax TaxID=35708 RepID=A0A0A9HMA2_ARUDO
MQPTPGRTERIPFHLERQRLS